MKIVFRFVFGNKDYCVYLENNKTKYGYIVDDKDVYLVADNSQYKLESIPSGTIFLFNGDTIPEGYKICNGEDNTPNITFTDFPDIKYIIKM